MFMRLTYFITHFNIMTYFIVLIYKLLEIISIFFLYNRVSITFTKSLWCNDDELCKVYLYYKRLCFPRYIFDEVNYCKKLYN